MTIDLKLTPYLTVKNAAEAVAFYIRAFGAIEVGPRLHHPNGKIMHTELALEDARFMLADEFPEYNIQGPEALGGTPIRINLEVDAIEAFAERAVAAGAKLVIPISDQFYGQRSGRLMDPFGHLWILSKPIENLSVEEIERRAQALFETAEQSPNTTRPK